MSQFTVFATSVLRQNLFARTKIQQPHFVALTVRHDPCLVLPQCTIGIIINVQPLPCCPTIKNVTMGNTFLPMHEFGRKKILICGCQVLVILGSHLMNQQLCARECAKALTVGGGLEIPIMIYALRTYVVLFPSFIYPRLCVKRSFIFVEGTVFSDNDQMDFQSSKGSRGQEILTDDKYGCKS